MRSIIMAVLCAAIAAALGACGGSSCEDAVANAAKVYGFGGDGYAGQRATAIKQCKEEKYPEAMRACVIAARSREAVEACQKLRQTAAKGGAEEYVQKSKRIEADLNLDRLKKSLKVHFVEMATFPVGSAPLTPSTPCCEGPNHTCAPNPAEWAGNPVWEALDWTVDDPHYFQYSYEAKEPTVAIARAVGDLDCDGTTVTYELRCEAPDGNPVCTVTSPTNAD